MFAQRRYPSHLHSPIVLVRKNLVDLWRNPVGDPFKSHDVACQGSRTIVGLRTARDAGSQPPSAEEPSTAQRPMGMSNGGAMSVPPASTKRAAAASVEVTDRLASS